MTRINIYYIAVVILAAYLWIVFQGQNKIDVSFYGFAETRETEINYNHSVMVNSILVSPGQSVKLNEPLLQISRINSKETLQDQNFRIEELKAKSSEWKTEKENELNLLQSKHISSQKKIEEEVKLLTKKIEYNNQLKAKLNTIEKDTNISYNVLKDKVESFRIEKRLLIQTYEIEKKGIIEEIRKGLIPYMQQISRFEADKEFEESHMVQDIAVMAPSDGLIGNIQCKEAEHIPAYRTLISFYEPHPSYIKAFVHEDLMMTVKLGDLFWVKSIKNVKYNVEGIVSGLGSRIVEIPERLRRTPEYKTYGREVTLKITEDNNFLQKEKVALELKRRIDNQDTKIFLTKK